MSLYFWRASGGVLMGWAVPILVGDPRLIYGVLPWVQVGWIIFCMVRLAQLCWRGAHRKQAPEWERESFGLALGGLVSSFGMLLLASVVPIRHH